MYNKPKISPIKLAFIRTVVAAAGVKVVKIRTAHARGNYGFVRIVGDTLERSTKHWRSEDDCFAAAHKHYNLRAA